MQIENTESWVFAVLSKAAITHAHSLSLGPTWQESFSQFPENGHLAMPAAVPMHRIRWALIALRKTEGRVNMSVPWLQKGEEVPLGLLLATWPAAQNSSAAYGSSLSLQHDGHAAG